MDTIESQSKYELKLALKNLRDVQSKLRSKSVKKSQKYKKAVPKDSWTYDSRRAKKSSLVKGAGTSVKVQPPSYKLH